MADTLVTWALVAAQWALNIAMLASPLGWIVVGITGFIAATLALIKVVWDARHAILKAFKDSWNWIKAMASKVWNWVIWPFRKAIDWLKGNWHYVAPILLGPIGAILVVIDKFGDDIIGVFEGVWSAIASGFSWLWDTISGGVSDAWNAIVGVFDSVWERIKGFFSTAKQWYEDNVPGWLRGIIEIVPNFIGDGASAIGGLLGIGGEDASAARAQARVSNVSSNFAVDQINIQVPSGEPEAIARGVRGAFEDEFTTAAHALDTAVAR